MAGGMGGGMMGTLMRSALGGTKGTKPEVPQITADEYDVDRWKRADDLDNMTMVQAVRSDWDQRQSDKQGLGQKLKTLLNRRKKAGCRSLRTCGRRLRPAGPSPHRR